MRNSFLKVRSVSGVSMCRNYRVESCQQCKRPSPLSPLTQIQISPFFAKLEIVINPTNALIKHFTIFVSDILLSRTFFNAVVSAK